MRNYFSFSLKGSRICLAWIGYMLCMVAVSFIVTFISSLGGDVLVNGRWAAYLFGSIGACIAVTVITGALLFRIIRMSIEALSFRDENFSTDFNLKEFLVIVVRDGILTCITFGIYLPWFITHILRYVLQNTSHRYNYLGFNGRPMTLFGLITVLIVLPILAASAIAPIITLAAAGGSSMLIFWYLLIFLLIIFISGLFYTLFWRWTVDLNYGRKRVVLDVPVFQGVWYVMGQMFLSLITALIYYPMMYLRIYRYFVSHTVSGEENIESRGGVTLSPMRDFLFLWGQLLLSVITFGIYYSWAYTKILSRFAARTYSQSADGPAMPIPERD